MSNARGNPHCWPVHTYWVEHHEDPSTAGLRSSIFHRSVCPFATLLQLLCRCRIIFAQVGNFTIWFKSYLTPFTAQSSLIGIIQLTFSLHDSTSPQLKLSCASNTCVIKQIFPHSTYASHPPPHKTFNTTSVYKQNPALLSKAIELSLGTEFSQGRATGISLYLRPLRFRFVNDVRFSNFHELGPVLQYCSYFSQGIRSQTPGESSGLSVRGGWTHLSGHQRLAVISYHHPAFVLQQVVNITLSASDTYTG